MSNVATKGTGIPTALTVGQPKGLLYPVVITFDTTGADLTVFASTDAQKFVAVMGMKYAEASAHNLIWKSGSNTLVTEEKPANTIVDARIGRPLFICNKGESLILQCGTAAISSMLMYILEIGRLDLRNL